MPQIFPRSANTIAKVSLIALPLTVAGLVWVCLQYMRSSYGSNAGVVRRQPVPFSHQHHVGVLGIDCRYCHSTVEESSYASLPPTKTCMNCHSQIWVGSDMLKPVRDSYRSGKSLRVASRLQPARLRLLRSQHSRPQGRRLHTCHGRIDEMPFTYQVPSLLMEWCLDCHRIPTPHLRPQAEIFNVKWQPPADQA